MNQHALHVHTLRPLRARSTYDLGLLGVMIHLLGDATNNLLVMISAVVVWQTSFERADAIASLLVGMMIIGTAVPLMRSAGRLLLEIAPSEIDLSDVAKDIKSLKGVEDIHELHAFSLSKPQFFPAANIV